MKAYNYLTILVPALILAVSCHRPAAEPSVIRMAELKEAAVPQAGLPCFSSEERILLDREPNEWSVALPEKVVVAGERIYIMGFSGDMRLTYVSEYDHEGRAVRMMGRRGRGPGEYTRANCLWGRPVGTNPRGRTSGWWSATPCCRPAAG